MWVRFLEPHVWKPKPTVTHKYPVGYVANLPHAAAEAMIAKGVAEATSAVEPIKDPPPPAKPLPDEPAVGADA